MQIRLDKIGGEPFRWRETVSVSAGSLERSELLELGKISFSGQVWIESPGFRVAATLSYRQTVACDRCLAPIEQEVESELRLLVLVNAPESADSEIELTAEDLEVLHLTGEVLDTGAVMREQLQLNVPMRALCREDCQGLCPTCGANRNEVQCNCGDQTVDPRWEALREWKD